MTGLELFEAMKSGKLGLCRGSYEAMFQVGTDKIDNSMIAKVVNLGAAGVEGTAIYTVAEDSLRINNFRESEFDIVGVTDFKESKFSLK